MTAKKIENTRRVFMNLYDNISWRKWRGGVV